MIRVIAAAQKPVLWCGECEDCRVQVRVPRALVQQPWGGLGAYASCPQCSHPVSVREDK